jgi:hypothetical protein
MSKRRQFINFVARATLWGVLFGVLSSIPLVYSFLWVYSYLGFLLAILHGTFIGLLNGIALGRLRFYHPADNEKSHRHRMLLTSIAVSAVGTFLFFLPLVYPLVRLPTYPSGEPPASPIPGLAICIAPLAFGSAFIASFASRRVKYRTVP